MELQIQGPGGKTHRYEIESGIYTVGSEDGCRICLAHKSVDARHAVLTVRGGTCWIEDLDAHDGTHVDGVRVKGRVAVGPGQEVVVGAFRLLLLDGTPAQPAAAEEPSPAPAAGPATPPPPEPAETEPPAPAPPRADLAQKRSIKQQIHRELLERLDIKRLTASRIDQKDLSRRARRTIASIVNDVRTRLPAGLEPKALIKEVYDEAVGLGPLEDFLADPDITEIMVNGANQVYVEKGGKLTLTDQTFMDDASVLAIIERIVSPIGRRIDESQPYVDARLPDGSRVNAIIHPLSLIGPCLTIRKFSQTPFTDGDLVGFGTTTPAMNDFLRVCVRLRKNIVVSGGTGCGKTTLLNVLSGYLPTDDRIVTIEDAAELRLGQTHLVRLEARPPNIEGRGAVTIRDLVRNALRMRPDRIVIGECRGGEALDMLQAMNTGHDGSLTTVHANSPRDVISRLETMVLMSGMELPVRAIREQIASAVHLIVHEARLGDGSRKILKVTEIVGLEGDQITMQDILEFNQTGVDAEGGTVGHFRATGAVPTFIAEVEERGLTIDRGMFDPRTWEQ